MYSVCIVYVIKPKPKVYILVQTDEMSRIIIISEDEE